MRLSIEVLLGVAAVALVLSLSLPGADVATAPRTYAEECDHEGCSQEEVRELYASYKGECIDESCSQEEINELSGGTSYQSSMMNAFLKYQWYIRAQDISTSAMASNAAWLYSGANYTGLLYQVSESANQSVPDFTAVGFNDITASLIVGPNVYLATFGDINYRGAQLVVSANQSSLGSPFLKSISSARVSLYTNIFTPAHQNLATAVQEIEDAVGAPAAPGAQVSRANAGINSNFEVQFDVGGEGPVNCNGVVAGFASAMNLNSTLTATPNNEPPMNTTCRTATPIPNLVFLQPWDTNPSYPFVSQFADYVTMQNAPLTTKNVSEITRVLRKGGSVALWIDQDAFQAQIDQLARNLNTTPMENVYDEFHGQAGHPKILIVDNR